MKQDGKAPRRRWIRGSAKFAGQRRRPRRELLASTALQASATILLAFPAAAQAQLAATARPTGGAVVAGAASISQNTTRTDVSQTSQRAAVNWTSYDIGSQHTVVYQQPNAQAIVLNRVVGPDPSQIAGRIQANGQVVITNQSGVVFQRGAQVDVQSLVVSTAGISNRNFMAGRMEFNRPGRPDARISNEGSISVAQAGLAALVAPQVANSGTINARMGRVVLAGAEAHTVDMYGDGLMSVDVTRNVTRAPNGATALVTNTGTIQADGGTIVLTARAADGIMQDLVSNKGRLQANTVGDRPGTVVVSAVGGSVTIEGTVQADGRAPGTAGGTVQLAATDTVAVQSGARISATGRTTGGTIAIGTTPARARAQGGVVPDDAARQVLVADGARISADGRGTGSGGTVALLSTRNTAMAGRITARGGRRGGDGGRVEISGKEGLLLTGSVSTRAPAGRTGLLTIDPTDLTIGGDGVGDSPNPPPANNSAVPNSQTISATTFNSSGSSLDTDLNLQATNSITLNPTTGVSALVNNHSVTFSSATITFNTPLTVANTLSLNGGSVTQAAGAVITAGTLTGSLTGSATLIAAQNAVSTLGAFSTGTGFALDNRGTPLVVGGLVSAGSGTITLRTNTLTVGADLGATAVLQAPRIELLTDALAVSGSNRNNIGTNGTLVVTPSGDKQLLIVASTTPGGNSAALELTPTALQALLPTAVPGTTRALQLGSLQGGSGPLGTTTTASSISVQTALDVSSQASVLGLYTAPLAGDTGAITQSSGAGITIDTLVGSATGGANLDGTALGVPTNNIANLGSFTTGTANLTLRDNRTLFSLTVPSSAVVTGGVLDLSSAGTLAVAGNVRAATSAALTGTDVSQSAGVISGPTVTFSGAFSQSGGATVGTTVNIPDGLTQSTAIGTIWSGNTLTVSASQVSGKVASGQDVALTYTGASAISGTVLADRDVSITRAAGTSLTVSGTLTAKRDILVTQGTRGGTPVAGGGITQSGGAISAGRNVSIYATDGGTSQTGGTVAGQQVTIVALNGGNTFTSTTQANVTGGVGTPTFSGSADPGLPGTLTASASASRPTLVRLDGTTVSPSNPVSGDTVELHSTGNTNATGVVTAATLTGTAGYARTSFDTNNLPQYDTTGTPSGSGSATFSGSQAVAGLGSYSVGGAFSLTNANTQGLAISGPVKANTVAITAASMTVSGDIGACTVGATNGTVQLTANATTAANATIGVTGGIVGGEASVSLSAAGGTSVSGGIVNAPTVSVTGDLAVSGPVNTSKVFGGSVSASGTITQSGGTLHATTLSPTTVSFTGGDLYAGGSLTITAGATISGTVATPGSLTVNATSGLSTSATLLAGGSNTLNVTGNFAQSGGTIGAGTDLSVLATGTASQSAGSLLAGGTNGTLLVRATNTGNAVSSASLAGTLSGANIQLIEPATNLTLTVAPSAVGDKATVTVGALVNTFHCPGCDDATPASGYATGTASTPGTGTPTLLRMDAGALVIGNSTNGGAVGAATVEIHSAGDTTQTAGGIITATTLQGTAGYAATVPASTGLPTYNDTPSTVGVGSISLATATNQVTNLGPLYAGSSVAVGSGSALTVGARIAADGRNAGNQSISLSAPSLTVDGPSGGILQFGTVTGGPFSTTPGTTTFTPITSTATNTSFSRVNLSADALAINGTGTLVEALGGRVAIAPLTAGHDLSVDATRGGVATVLSITPGDLSHVNTLGTGGPRLLQLGSVADTPVSGSTLTAAARDVAVTTAVDLTSIAGTLGLYATRNVSETAGTGAVTVGTLVGGTGNNFQFDAASGAAGTAFYNTAYGNVISNLGPITAGVGTGGKSLSVASSVALTTVDTISAQGGTVTLTSSGALALGAAGGITTGAGTGSVALQSKVGITQSAAAAAAVTTGTLTGQVADGTGTTSGLDATLTNALNKVTTLGQFLVGYEPTPGAAPLRINAQGNLTFVDNQALTVAAGSTVAGRIVSLTTNGTANAMTVNGLIGACEISTTTAGMVTLTASGPITIASGAVVGGERSVTLSGTAATVGGPGTTVSGGTLDAGTGTTGGTISVTGNLALTSGLVVAGTVDVMGGTLTQSGGTLYGTVQNGTYAFNGGQSYSTGAVTVTSTGLASGSVLSGSSVTVNSTAASFGSAGDVFATGGDVHFVLTGTGASFSQTGGRIGATGTVTVAGSADGLTPLAGTIEQTAGTIAAGTLVQLYGSGAGTVGTTYNIQGALAAPTVRVVEPGAALNFSPSQLAGGLSLSGAGASVTYHCPGCDANTAAITPTTVTFSTSGTAGTLRVDGGNALTLGSALTATTSVELHSSGNTVQTSPGTVTTGMLTGTAGYAATVTNGALPRYGATAPAGGGGLQFGTLSNSIGTLGAYYAAGDVAVNSTVALSVKDQVVAGGSTSPAGSAATISLTAPTLTVDASGTNRGSLQFGSVTAGGVFSATPGAATVSAPTTAPTSTTYDKVNLTTDQLFLTGSGTLVNAYGGAVSIVPATSGADVTIGPDHFGSPWIAGPELARIDTLSATGGPRLIRLGSLDGTATTADTITISGNLPLTNSAATLGLYSNGSITENAGGGIQIGRAGGTQVVGTITGAAASTVSLNAATGGVPNNHFDVLGGPAVAGGAGGFSAGNGLNVSDSPDANSGRTGLLVQGTVSSGTGDLSLLSAGPATGGPVGGTIRIGGAAIPGATGADGTVLNGTLDATGKTLTLIARNGDPTANAITELRGSSLIAATLTGQATTAYSTGTAATTNYSVVLPDAKVANPAATATNNIGTLDRFLVGADLSGATPPAETRVGVQGAFQLEALGAATLTLAGQVSAKSVAVTGNQMAINATGLIGACTVGGTAGDIALTAEAGTLAVSGQVGGQTTVALTAPGGTSVTAGLVNAGTTLSVGTLLTLSAGTVFADAITVGGGTGAITQSGGLLHANTLNPGTVAFSAGDLYAGNPTTNLSITVPASLPSGTVATRGNLTVTATGGLDTAATLEAGGSVTIAPGGAFNQSGGTIAAGTSIGIDSAGTITQASAGTMAAGTTIQLRADGSGSASLTGTLSADQVLIVEPAAAVTASPGTLRGAATVNVPTLANVTHCPGCDTNTASSSYTLGVTLGTGSPTLLRVDGQTISLGTVAAGTVELHSVGDTNATGAITATTLTGSAGYQGTPLTRGGPGLPTYSYAAGTAGSGSATFSTATNNIQRLGDYQARSGFTLVDTPNQANGAGLVIAGTVRAGLASDPLALPLQNGAPVSITLTGAQGNLRVGLSPAQGSSAAATGSVLAGDTITLTLSGALTEESTSRIVANLLTGSATSASLPGPNAVGSVGPFTTNNGAFTLHDGSNALQIVNPLNAGTGTVTLTAGSVSQTSAGVVTAGTLTGSTTGTTDLTAAANQVASLGAYTAGGDFGLNDARSLTVAGAVQAGPTPPVSPGGRTLALTVAGDLGIDPGSLTAQTVTLNVTGATTERNGGTITAGLLNGGSGAATSLGSTNAVATVGPYSSGGNFTLNDGGNALQVVGTLNAGANTVALTAGSVSQTAAGVVTAGLLTGSTTGATNLSTAVNAVATVGPYTTGGDFRLNDGGNALQVVGALNAGANTVLLTAGSVSQTTAGIVTAGALTGSTAGATNLSTAVNAVATVGPYTTGGDFRLNDGANALQVTGALNAGANTVSLTASSLGQTSAGVVTAGTLTGSTTGTTDLTAAANQVASLGAYTAGGDFGLNDARSLTVAGAVQAGPTPPVSPGGRTLALTVAGDLGIDPGSLTAQTVTLNVTGATTERNGGTITAGLLNGGSGAATSLGSTNAVATVGPYSSGGNFTLNDGGNALQVVGTLNAGANTVALTAGSVSQTTAGAVTAGTLTGSTSGTTDLTTAANQVAALDAYTTGGNFLLNDGRGLTVTGAVQAGPTPPVSSGGRTLGLTVNGDLAIDPGSLTAQTVTLAATGTITERNGGRINAGTLSASGSQASFGSGTNRVDTLGSVASPGGFSFTDSASLVTSGPVTAAGGPITLVVGGDLTTQGAVSAGGAVTLQAGGQILDSAGSAISGAGVTTNSGGVTTVSGSVSSPGPVRITANGVVVNGTVTGNPVSIDAGSGTLSETATGIIRGSSLGARSGGQASLAGLVTVGDLAIAANGVVVSGALTGTTVRLDAGNGDLGVSAAGQVTGSSLTSNSGGATTFAGRVGVSGPATVTANGVAINGSFTSGDLLTLNAGTGSFIEGATGILQVGSLLTGSAGPTVLAGATTVTGGPTTITGGGVTVTGSLNGSAGVVTLSAGGAALTEASGGLITAASLVASSDAAVSLAGVLGVGTTAAIRSGGDAKVFGQVTAGQYLTLDAAGTAALTGSTVTSPRVVVTAPSVEVNGGTLFVGGQPQASGATFASLPTAAGGGSGVFFEATSSFVQSGTTYVRPLSGFGITTIRLDLKQGSATFGTLDTRASGSDSVAVGNLILNLGLGTATGGPLLIGNLALSYTDTGLGGFGPGGANLTGTVGAQVGTGASGVAIISPRASQNYRINGCPVQSVNCVVFNAQPVPIGNPLKELSLNFFREQDDDTELLVPNISDQGL